MKHKVSELDGALLNAAVAKALGLPVHPGPGHIMTDDPVDTVFAHQINPSRAWADGGPIIERERIAVYWLHDCWVAGYDIDAEEGYVYSELTADPPHIAVENGATGPTPLIAAMRAFVASKFGDEVELP